MTIHEKLKEVLKRHPGKQMTTAEIEEAVMKRFPDTNRSSIRPNDHAEGNKGQCRCIEEGRRILARPERGIYRVLKSDV